MFLAIILIYHGRVNASPLAFTWAMTILFIVINWSIRGVVCLGNGVLVYLVTPRPRNSSRQIPTLAKRPLLSPISPQHSSIQCLSPLNNSAKPCATFPQA